MENNNNMTEQSFYEFRTNVEGSAVSYANLESGKAIVTCEDGVRLLVSADGDSEILAIVGADEVIPGYAGWE